MMLSESFLPVWLNGPSQTRLALQIETPCSTVQEVLLECFLLGDLDQSLLITSSCDVSSRSGIWATTPLLHCRMSLLAWLKSRESVTLWEPLLTSLSCMT